MEIYVLTTTYNRSNHLSVLYSCLQKQTYKKFKWIIVDDGSQDETQLFAEQWVLREKNFEIQYNKKDNGGKSRAVNYGLNTITGSGFVIIIDDDEILYENAIEVVNQYAEKYKDSNVGGMEFLRNDLDGNPIANYNQSSDLIMSVQQRKKKKMSIDGYAGYYLDKLGSIRFPEFENERYVGPGVLQMLISKKYNLLWPNAVIGETEYLQGGITKSGRRLRIKSPKGMIIYCSLLQNSESGFCVRMKYSIMGFAYIWCARKNLQSILNANLGIKHLKKIALIPGILLGCYWDIKYCNGSRKR